jgi:hypothetical protein
MWPWAHAALGYLCYTLYLRLRTQERPAGRPVLVLALATQLPDLVDKPLAWYVDVLPYGRTLAHSVLLGGVVAALISLLLRRQGYNPESVAFAVGYYSHLFGDAFGHLIGWNVADLAFLLWPVLPIPGVESEVEGLLNHLRDIEGSPLFLFGLVLTIVGLVAWYRDGTPGVRKLLALVRTGVVAGRSD